MNIDPLLIVSIAVLLVFAFGMHVLLFRKKRLSKKNIIKIQTFWKDIERIRMDTPKQAILEADKLLDFALKKCGFSGSLGEKLKKAPALFTDINGVWSAHKLRNRIAHEIDHKLSSFETKNAINNFKKAIQDLGVSL